VSARALIVVTALVFATPAAATTRPPISGRDVETGKTVSLRQFVGRPVLVNVWGSWCAPCNREAPLLASFARAHRAQIAVLGIDVTDSRAGVRAWYRRYGRAYPSIWDPQALLAGDWSRGTPTTLVFDRKHRLVRTIEGAVTKAQLDAALRRVIRR
jgi:cytochrome c biogenesis protein CcmG, thiol:disulfide interchange protein DsbE